MAHLGLKPILTDMNCRLWNKDTGVMSSKTIDGELVRLTAESADVDLYVCGFVYSMHPAWVAQGMAI